MANKTFKKLFYVLFKTKIENFLDFIGYLLASIEQ